MVRGYVMKLRRAVLTPVIVAAVALGSGGWLLQRGASEPNVYANARLFEDVLRRVNASFVDSRDTGDLYRMAIDGMLKQLGDPHSAYLPADEYEKLRVQTEGEYGGLGVQIIKRGDYITVISPLPGTPGERAGLRAGAAIAEVDGVATKSWTEDEAVSRLRGPRGSRVVLSVLRAGMDQPIKFDITREEIHIKAIPTAYLIAPDVGYTELVLFNATATNELRSTITKLRQQGARRLILDLRQNPGGLLEEGSQVSDLFLPKPVLIVETKSRVAGQNQKLLATTDDEFPNMPIVVLVGPGSASASEIVAGALQDHDRALVLGNATYGKGSVQTVFPLGGNNWLKLTTARWYTPSGRSIQRAYEADGSHPTTALADTAEGKRPAYKTDSGRTVYGGGGIVPDLEIDADTLTAQERALRQELAQYGSEYATQRLKYSVEFIRSSPRLAEGFEVTDAMLDRFYAQLQAAGVKLDRQLFRGARRWLAFDVGYDIAYSKWGQEAARRRTNAVDPQVRTAVELLHQADSPAALLKAADRLAPQTAGAGKQ
ncbi:MAG: S41 family peptidase [Gemmatimonadetes bacterium]|nr:S41 family peptidase [Gemmatimonadota bacterium]